MSLQGPVEGVVLGRPASAAIISARPPAASQDWPDLDIRPECDPAPRLADGAIVDIVVIRAKVRTAFQGRRFVELFCQLVSDTQSDEQPSLKWFLPLPKERPGGKRQFRISQDSKFWRAWVAANGGRQPSRRDEMSLRVFQGRLLRVTTRLVKTTSTSQGATLPEAYWHSVVNEVAQ